MRDVQVIICSTVRDCGEALADNIPWVEQLRGHFGESHVVIVENDSIDHTKEVLADWTQDAENVHVIAEDLGLQTIPDYVPSTGKNPFYSAHRIQLMASYRNKYMAYIEEHLPDPDYLIIIDLDIHHVSLEGIMHSFGQPVEWHAISSNGRVLSPLHPFSSVFYDGYAFQEWGDQRPQIKDRIEQYQLRLRKLKPEPAHASGSIWLQWPGHLSVGSRERLAVCSRPQSRLPYRSAV